MKFGNRYVWIVLQFLSGAVAVWMGAKFTAELFHYLAYGRPVVAEVVDWGVLEFSPDQFKICATYEFSVRNEKFVSQHLFNNPSFHNRYAAEDWIKNAANKKWTAWYRLPTPPKSTLVRELPIKTALHLLVAFLTFLYFLWLRRYLYKRSFA